MQLTLLWLHPWVLTAKPFKLTTQLRSTQHSVHQSVRFSKVHNSVKLDVRSSKGDDTRCDARGTIDRNRKFSEIKRSKLLKLVHNLQCIAVISQKGPCYWIPLAKIVLKVGDFIGDFYQQISQNFFRLAMPPLKKVEVSFLWSISVCARTQNYVFVAAILSELHSP